MRLTLGINTCFAVKRWPHPDDWGPIVRDRLGLRVVQHSFDLADPARDDPDALWADLDVLGLELHSTFTGLGAYSWNLLLDPEARRRKIAGQWFEKAIDFTAKAGAVATGGHVGAFAVADFVDPDRRATRWRGLVDSMTHLAQHARRAGLSYLVVENLAAAREPSTMAMIRELLAEGDEKGVPIRLCLDVGHMCAPGTSGDDRDPYAWLRQLGREAPIVQLQQSDADGDRHWPFTARCNALGRIDADRVVEALGEGGVEETTLILEVIPPFEQDDDEVLDDLVASADHWRETLTRHGVLAP